MSNLRIGIFADKQVGEKTLDFISSQYKDDLMYLLLTNNSTINHQLINPEIIHYEDELYNPENIEKIKNLQLDYIILAWWPNIIKSILFSCPKRGIINFHPSLLPYNRGKNYNFWNIIEDVPFGVSIHFVSELIDSGDIIFQSKIEKQWEDTGESLYNKAKEEMINLFISSYPQLISGKFKRIKQQLSKGSFHYAKELENASKIDLDKSYSGKELINILRARTFYLHPASWFEDKGNKYEIRISINKRINE